MPVFRLPRPASALARVLAAAALAATLIPAVDVRVAPPAALAANFVVNQAADPGDGTCDASCTLRDAIVAAGNSAGADTITFSAAITTPIVLASALPTIAQPLTIDGSGQNITVDGANTFRVFFATAPLTLTTLTVQRGRGGGDGFGGGGAYFGSTGTVSAVNFISNTAIAAVFGAGGAYFASSATLSGGSFISNTATGNGANGGGAYVGGAAVVSGTTFMTNTAAIGYGGGLYVFGTSTLTNTTFISNTAAADGGGVYGFGAAAVTGSTFERNRAAGIFSSSGGGAALSAGGSVASSSFMSNTSVLNGGGVNSFGALTLSDSTFTGNSSGNGGGAYLAAAGTLTNTDFTCNSALSDGGGLYLGATTAILAPTNGGDIAPITGATFTGNTALAGSGGGAYVAGPSAISGSTFNGNSAAAEGGGVQATGATTVTASSFVTNTAGSGGGGAFGPATVSGSTFMSNTTTAEGGGAKFRDPTLISASSFIGNLAIGHGGGLWSINTISITTIYAYNNQTVATGLGRSHGGGAYLLGGGTVTDSTFDSNKAQNGNGGGIFGSGITLKDFVLTGNQALCEDQQQIVAGPQAVHDGLCGNGGGAYLSSDGVCDNGLTVVNYAEGDGGGAYLSGAQMVNYDLMTFRENTAGEEGGGAYLEAISGNWGSIEFSDNEAGTDGGGLYLDQSHLDIDNALWSTNRAVNSAGAADISMSYNNASLDAKHVTYFTPQLTGFQLSVSVGTDLPDEQGQQDTVATLTNVIFRGYDVAVQGKAPTSTITIQGVLWSSINTTVGIGNYSLLSQYTGDADFVDEAGGDFHLLSTSDAIDRGIDAGVATDFDGYPRFAAADLGAYEFVPLVMPSNKIYVPFVVRDWLNPGLVTGH